MNNIFNQAIESHVEWKRTFRKSLEGGAPPLNPHEVANCHACDLGKWMYGEGIRYNRLPSFDAMCAAHEVFHRAAAEVVHHQAVGDKLKAESLLKPDGACGVASANLVRAIMDCANELTPSVAKGIRNNGTVNDLLRLKGDDEVQPVEADTAILAALRKMVDHNIGSLAIYKEGRFLGILSERGYLRKLVEPSAASLDAPVSEMIDANPVYITPRDSVEQCMALMTSAHTRHLAVVEDTDLVGIISIGDVLKQVMACNSEHISQMQNYIHGSYGAR